MFLVSKQKGCSLKSRQLISKGASTLALAGWQQGCSAQRTPLLPVCLPRGERRQVFHTYAKIGGTGSGQWCALRFVVAEISQIWSGDLPQNCWWLLKKKEGLSVQSLSLSVKRSSGDTDNLTTGAHLLYCAQVTWVRPRGHAQAASHQYVSKRVWKHKTDLL